MDSAKPWCGLDLSVSVDCRALFNASVSISVGSGTSIKFWEDAWIGGLDASSIAPALLKHIRPSVRAKQLVVYGLRNHAWAGGISGELSIDALRDYLKLWSAVQNVPTRGDGVEDSFRWKWTSNGRYSPRSAYRVLFHGRTALPGAANVWNAFAPPKV
jgi:hypothetical protein